MTTLEAKTCGWRCGDPAPEHKHFTVIVRDESNKLLGRVTPDGYATNRKLFAAVLSKARAEEIASEINAGGTFTAIVRDF